MLQRGQDGAHAGVRYHKRGRREKTVELVRLQEIRKADEAWTQTRSANLREHIWLAAPQSPTINGLYQAIERAIGANGHENHNTLPRNLGPGSPARCGHCVNHRPAWRPAIRPAIDSSSAFATLSTQIVFAPSSLPKRTTR